MSPLPLRSSSWSDASSCRRALPFEATSGVPGSALRLFCPLAPQLASDAVPFLEYASTGDIRPLVLAMTGCRSAADEVTCCCREGVEGVRSCLRPMMSFEEGAECGGGLVRLLMPQAPAPRRIQTVAPSLDAA